MCIYIDLKSFKQMVLNTICLVTFPYATMCVLCACLGQKKSLDQLGFYSKIFG